MQPRRVRGPEFLPGFTWINTRRPLTVAEDLRGRVAILDFCTYCCINCMDVLSGRQVVECRTPQGSAPLRSGRRAGARLDGDRRGAVK